MIINYRGASGSGKSVLARRVMACYDAVMPLHAANRKRPVGYLCTREPGRALYVVGSYETACGGADRFAHNGALDEIYARVRAETADGHDALLEGLIVESDVNRLAACHDDGLGVLVLVLDTPIEVCLASIEQRRQARGDKRPLNPKNTVNRVPQIKRRAERLAARGVDVRWADREQAYQQACAALGLTPTAHEWWPAPQAPVAAPEPAAEQDLFSLL